MSSQEVKKIYDLIDSGNTTAAETRLEKAQAKYGASDLGLRSAECLILLRQRHYQQAMEIAKMLAMSQQLQEPSYINAVVHVLQTTCCWPELATLLEKSVQLMGGADSKETTTAQVNLLTTYMLMKNYTAAQQMAVTLHKKTGNPVHQVHAIMANLERVPPNDSEHILLKLSSKMLETLLGKNTVQAPLLGRMYVNVLLQQKRYQDALQYVASAEATRTMGLIVTRYEVLLDILKQEHATANSSNPLINAVAKKAWKHDPDNWTFISAYLDSLQPTAAEITDLPQLEWTDMEQEKDNMSKCWSCDNEAAALQLCRQLQEQDSSPPSRRNRGPYMAELQLVASVSSSYSGPTLTELLMAYCDRFGTKGTCYLDIATVVGERDPTAIQKLITFLEEKADIEEKKIQEDNSDKNKNTLLCVHGYRMLSMKLRLLCQKEGQQIPDAAGWIHKCLEYYDRHRALSTTLEWSEEGLLDGYLLIAANVAAWQWWVNGKDPHWAAMALGVFVDMDRKKNNPGALVLITLMAQQLGLVDLGALQQLDFKSVQHVSMDHVAYWPLERGHAMEQLVKYRSHAKCYFAGVPREISLLRGGIMKHLSWPKMKELDAFEHRLLNCLPRQETLIYSASEQLRQCQTAKYTLEHISLTLSTVEDALTRLLSVNNSSDSDNKPSFASCCVSSALSVTNATPADDDTFLTAFLFHSPNGHAMRDWREALLEKPSEMWRRQRAVVTAAALLVLYDVMVLESRRAPKPPAPKVKKGAPSPPPPPPEKQPCCPRWGLTGEFFRQYCSLNSASESANSKDSMAVMKCWSNALAALTEAVAVGNAAANNAPPPHDSINNVTAALEQMVSTIVTEHSVFAAVLPFGAIFTAVLSVVPPKALPVAAMANAYGNVLQRCQTVLREKMARISNSSTISGLISEEDACSDQHQREEASLGEGRKQKLVEWLMALKMQSLHELLTYVNNLSQDVVPCNRRK